MNPTLYDILGVSRGASRDQIRKAWREAADRFEPGEGGSTKQFRLFNEAAEVLLDPERRKAYDAQLDHEGAEAEQTPQPEKAAQSGKAPQSGKAAGTEPGRTSEGEPAPDEEVVAAAATVPGPAMPGAARATTTPPAPTVVPEASDGGEERSPRGVLPRWVLAVLGVLTALAVGGASYFVAQAERAEGYREALDRAPAAAESAGAAILSYDHESLEADRDAAAKFLTDGYRGDYVDTFDKLVAESATETKATVEAEVLASSAMLGGSERDPDRVPVLLFVNQTTTSGAKSGEPSVALNRVRLDMLKVDGTWLVDGITSY